MFSRNEMPKLIMAALATALLFGGLLTAGHAQQTQPKDTLASIRPLLAEADSAMDAIERELSRITEKKQIEDSGSIHESNLDKAAQASNRALAALQAAAKNEVTQPRNANLAGALNEFEKTALAQRERAANILRKVGDIQSAVQQGSVLISVKLFDGVSAKDRAAFFKSLSPAAQDTYKRLAPGRFSGIDIKFYGLSNRVQTVFQSGLDACVPEANAALAVGCVGVCAASAGAACAGCLLATAGTAYVLAVYVGCKRTCGSCHWYSPWSCVCRVACLAAMVAAVAENSSPPTLAIANRTNDVDLK